MNIILKKLLAEQAELDRQDGEDQRQLAAVATEEKQVIEAAPSPDDERTHGRLTVLAGKTTILHRQIRLREQVRSGLNASLLNESQYVKGAVNTALKEKADAIFERLDKKLAADFPEVRLRGKLVEELAESHPLLRLIRKRLIGAVWSEYRGDHLRFATDVVNASERALAEILTPSKS